MSKKSVTELLPHGGVLIQNTADLFILEEFEKAGITWVGPYQIKATKLDPTIFGAKFPFTIYVDKNGLSWHGGRVVIYPASDFLKGEESATTTDLEVEMSAHTPTTKETIKKAAEINCPYNAIASYENINYKRRGFIQGAKWQANQTQYELESLRAERDGMVEALREAKDELIFFYKKTGTPPRIELDAKIYTTLAKYEKKL